jgi:hypothetical protein
VSVTVTVAEMARLRGIEEALKAYADPRHWATNAALDKLWIGTYRKPPWSIAEEALGEESAA